MSILPKNSGHIQAILGGVSLFILVIGGTWYVQRHIEHPTNPVVSNTSSSTPSPTVLGDVSAAQTNTQAELPASISAILSNFYAGYEGRDASRLAAYFTPDSGTNKFPLSELFKQDGYTDSPVSFTVIASAEQNSEWVVTVNEMRTNPDTVTQFPRTTLLVFVPGAADNAGWLLSSYSYVSASGKYNAFISE